MAWIFNDVKISHARQDLSLINLNVQRFVANCLMIVLNLALSHETYYQRGELNIYKYINLYFIYKFNLIHNLYKYYKFISLFQCIKQVFGFHTG